MRRASQVSGSGSMGDTGVYVREPPVSAVARSSLGVGLSGSWGGGRGAGPPAEGRPIAMQGTSVAEWTVNAMAPRSASVAWTVMPSGRGPSPSPQTSLSRRGLRGLGFFRCRGAGPGGIFLVTGCAPGAGGRGFRGGAFEGVGAGGPWAVVACS